MKKKVTITLDKKLNKQFSDYCKKRGMKVSARIELAIIKILRGGNKDGTD